MATRMQQRKGTAAQWAAADPILNAGEIGWESDTNKFKIGDGTNHWDDLTYFLDATDMGGSFSDYVPLTQKNQANGVAQLNADINVMTRTAIEFEGVNADAYETTLGVVEPTADRTITLPDASGTVALASDITVSASSTNTFSNKSISLSTNTITGTKAEFNAALSDSNFATTDGTETLTNKTLTSPIVSGLTISDNSIVLEGSTANDHETTLQVTDPTADRTITFPDATGTVALAENVLALSGGTMTGAITLSGAPSSDLHAATKAYVDGVAEGLHIHASVVAATTANVALATALENGDVLDGITLATGNRILVKNQTTTSENGIYVVQASGQPTRATDFDTALEVDSGDFVFVSGGTVNANTGWVQTSQPATVGTDPITFSQFSGAGTYSAGNGISLNGTVFSVNPAQITAALPALTWGDVKNGKSGLVIS
jgi:hypothetical protein